MSHLNSKDIKSLYESLPTSHEKARKHFGRALTLTEKILISHLDNWSGEALVRGDSYVLLRPDRVAMQDATAQMAILQFMQARLNEVSVPTTVHCDHLIRAKVGAESDLAVALQENKEVYDFLKSASSKYGIGFWEPGAGIIHQVVLEKYGFPGGMMIGCDSHTPNTGGLGMIAIGVGGADAVDVMAGQPWGVRWPRVIGVKLTGELNGWTAPKDIILKVASILTVAGGTGAIIEYFGSGTKSISCTGKATITNMGAELGATTSIFPFDERMSIYLRATDRSEIADLAEEYKNSLVADPEIEKDPLAFFDRLIEIDLDQLEPYIVGPHSPDLARPVSQLAIDAKENGYPDNLRYALLGSCTNSSYEDMSRAADVAEQGVKMGLKASIGFLITPGSEQIHQTIKRDGQMDSLEKMGGVVLANACGPCIGQWKREDISPHETNSIITSFNRNFSRRNDGNPETLAFMGSPEIITAFAFAGRLSFNPLTDELISKDGRSVRFHAPAVAPEIPLKGFVSEDSGYIQPAADSLSVAVIIKADSDRLQLLEPFEEWNGDDFLQLPVLIKAVGKCTTDHISPAGPWLKYRGHIDRISGNMFIGANNAFAKEAGESFDVLTGVTAPAHEVARHYKSEKLGWIVVGDQNYGEGSSREHAAMSPRYLGCKAVIVRSFARIHETNLKKQGVLALTFSDTNDYDKFGKDDRISLVNLKSLEEGSAVSAILEHSEGTSEKLILKHTMNSEQIEWFKAGSALNLIRRQRESL